VTACTTSFFVPSPTEVAITRAESVDPPVAPESGVTSTRTPRYALTLIDGVFHPAPTTAAVMSALVE